MFLEKSEYSVIMPSVVPTCTWEDVNKFRAYQKQLANIKTSLLAQMYLGDFFEKKYGSDVAARVLSVNNIEETLKLYDELHFMYPDRYPKYLRRKAQS